MSVRGRAGRVLVVAVIAGPGLAGVALPAHAVTPPGRYASPTGVASTDCAKATPCDIVTAINQAPTGSTITIERGTYGSAVAGLTDTFTDDAGAIHVQGASLAHPPIIYSATNHYGFELSNGSTLSDIEIHTTGSRSGVFVLNGTADHLRVFSSSAQFGACSVFGTLTDSLCVQSGAYLPAVDLYDGGDVNTTIRGVTAIATGQHGVGLMDEMVGSATITVNATNSIFQGRGSDIEATSMAGGVTVVNLMNSDYSSFTSLANGGTDKINAVSGDVSATPKFVDPAIGDYAERASSPTVDQGAADPPDETDVLGNPRTLGSAPDIGGYELMQKPSAGRLRATSTTTHVVTLTLKVNPEGLATKIHLVATHGRATVTSPTVSIGRGRTPKAVRLTVRGLNARTTYQIHAVATSPAGVTNSAKTSVRTRP